MTKQELIKKLTELVHEINAYEEGDTGDIPGYYIDEDLDRYVKEILELFKSYHETT